MIQEIWVAGKKSCYVGRAGGAGLPHEQRRGARGGGCYPTEFRENFFPTYTRFEVPGNVQIWFILDKKFFFILGLEKSWEASYFLGGGVKFW